MIQEFNKQYVTFLNYVFENKEENENLNDKYKKLVDVLIKYCSSECNLISIFRFLREVECDIQLKLNKIEYTNTSLYVLKLEKLVKTEIEILSLKFQDPTLREFNFHSKEPPSQLIWTDKKIALVELIYSINKSLNNGNVSICKIAKCFEYMFQVELGNYYDTFDEICCRKSKPTRYIESLIENLNNAIKMKIN